MVVAVMVLVAVDFEPFWMLCWVDSGGYVVD